MSIFNGKKLSIVLHVAAWTLIFLLPIFLTSDERRSDVNIIGRMLLRSCIYTIIFYTCYLWLIPKMLFRGKKWNFYISVIVLILGLYVLNETISRNFFSHWDLNERNKPGQNINPNPTRPPAADFRPKPGPQFKKKRDFRYPRRFDIYNYLFTSVLISGFSLGLRMSGKFNENEKKREELEKEKLSSELAFLKNQVSPHFFFNTLNNIYSLIEINTKEAQNAVLQLSKLMRYLLYESEKGDIMLSNEISFMKNYIDLMKLRLSDRVKLTYYFPEDYKDFPFPPLIFIPFVENAFKHGVSYRDKSFINIQMKMEGNNIEFECSNGIFIKKEDNAERGIGLENARRRLQLLFPGKHNLEITQNNQVFKVTLIIQTRGMYK